MDSTVVKVKFGNTLRRFTITTENPSFADLKQRIAKLFNLDPSSTLNITYVDDEEDQVTITDDSELHDAIFTQELNPLKLFVAVGEEPTVRKSANSDKEKSTASEDENKEAQSEGDESRNRLNDEIAAKLRAAFRDAANGVDAGAALLEPIMKQAPKIADVVEAFMKAGISASFEPTFSDNPFSCGVPTSGGPQAPSEPIPAANPQDTASQGDASSVPQTGMSADVEEKEPDEERTDRAVHHGVQCDVCGASPIIGPRYKSTVKTDYDLCRACFARQEVPDEYNKIERPLWRPRHHPFWHGGPPFGGPPFERMRGAGFGGPGHFGLGRGPAGPRPFHMGRGGGCGRGSDCGMSVDGKLDARFVQDVTVYDGTEVAPGTRLTKMWRVRNTGSIPWPQHTRLVHVGGDKLGAGDFNAVQIPEDGLKPEEEINVSVDLIAPEKPGRYVSHWRLLAPQGRKFGHRMWALIQVVAPNEPSPQIAESEASSSAEGNVQTNEVDVATEMPSAPVESATPGPEASSALEAEHIEEVMVAPEEAATAPPTAGVPAPSPQSPKTEVTQVGGFSFVEHPFPGEAALGFASNGPVADTAPAPQPAVRDVPVFFAGDAPVMVEAESAMGEPSKTDEMRLEELASQLESMGFADHNLNKELLKEHNLDMQRTVDELVAAAEWDPMLEELKEMGFTDAIVNRRLLVKNKGSVRNVVKELVKEYKRQASTTSV